jgi:1-deoxy-D-xylulose-5-phosphate reductoisomerase
VLCAADEVAVELFLSRRISFIDIAKIVQKTLEQHRTISQPSLEEILAADDWARECITRFSLGYCPEPERRSNIGIER